MSTEVFSVPWRGDFQDSVWDTDEFLNHKSNDRSSVVGRQPCVDGKTPESSIMYALGWRPLVCCLARPVEMKQDRRENGPCWKVGVSE